MKQHREEKKSNYDEYLTVLLLEVKLQLKQWNECRGQTKLKKKKKK